MLIIIKAIRNNKGSLANFLSASLLMLSVNAQATLLTAPLNGSFTMNLDRDALAPYYGYQLSTYWNTVESDYTNPLNTGNNLVSHISNIEISAINQVFDLTAIGTNPTGQVGQRFVKATSADFTLNSETLIGTPNTQIGMTGVQGFYAPLWPPNGGGVVNGDFSLIYKNPLDRQATWLESGVVGSSTGWTLLNNIFFTMPVYDLSNLSVVFSDADNWRLSGDLLMSPENGGMLQGAMLNDVGDFCLGVGSYAGCGQITAVPIPSVAWLTFGILLSLFGVNRHKKLLF